MPEPQCCIDCGAPTPDTWTKFSFKGIKPLCMACYDRRVAEDKEQAK